MVKGQEWTVRQGHTSRRALQRLRRIVPARESGSARQDNGAAKRQDALTGAVDQAPYCSDMRYRYPPNIKSGDWRILKC